jgi:hypothetical protein
MQSPPIVDTSSRSIEPIGQTSTHFLHPLQADDVFGLYVEESDRAQRNRHARIRRRSKHFWLYRFLEELKMVKEFVTDVDEAGRLVLPQEIAWQHGLQPGAKIRIGANGNGLYLRRPVTHLSKVYIEPTNRCNRRR